MIDLSSQSVVRQTSLSKELALPAPSRKIGPRDVFDAALQLWVSSKSIELVTIAEQLGIGRATIFRWVGSRDLLIGEVLWHACSSMWSLALQQAQGRGAERAADAAYRMMSGVLAFEPFSHFLQRDAEYALRLLMGRDSLVQTRIITEVSRELSALIEQREMATTLPVDDLAFMLVRIVESCIYSDQIAGRAPNPELARETIRILLSAVPVPDGVANPSAKPIGD